MYLTVVAVHFDVMLFNVTGLSVMTFYPLTLESTASVFKLQQKKMSSGFLYPVQVLHSLLKLRLDKFN